MGSKSWEDLWWISYVVLGVWIVNGALIIYLLNQIDSIVNVQLYDYGLQFSAQWADSYWGSSRLMLVFLGVPMALSAAVFVAGFRRFRKKAPAIFGKKKAEPEAEPPQIEASQAETPEVPAEEDQTVAPETAPEEETEEELTTEVESEPETEQEPEIEQEPESVIEPQLEVIQPEEIQVEQVNPEADAVECVEEPEVVEEPRAKECNGSLISCPNCNKMFNRPLVMLDFSSGTTRLVNICPFCNHILGKTSDSKKSDEETQQ